MTFLNSLKNRRADAAQTDSPAPGESALPLDRYDRLDAHAVVSKLTGCSQEELAGIETHERAHGDRAEVLNKLRYLRGEEPLHGYDGLSPEQISTALADADHDTTKRVREYERKFRRRPSVLDAVNRAGAAGHSTPKSISDRRDAGA